MLNNSFVTRFAPSPTGYMHIGNLRTALYAYLIAKSNGGRFILRIEDTDRERLVESAVDIIIQTLRTTNLIYDEGPDVGGEHGPYIQSERKSIYSEYAGKLIDIGAAYYCFCSKERLEGLHNDDNEGGGYDRHCRDLKKEDVGKLLAEGKPYVIRQKMPLEGTTSYTDAVFGEISVNNSELQDQVLMKADGYPTYNFAHVVDDRLMGITHVVRGSEYLTSTPKYALLYDAFGWERPVYVHLPLLMGKDDEGNISKLSKRHGAVSFSDLVADGYLPEAIINYIALLGWSPKENNEFFKLEDLIKEFEIGSISKSPSVFDYNKLIWFNGEYIRKLSPGEFKAVSLPFFADKMAENLDLDKILVLIQPRITKLTQIVDMVAFFNALPDYSAELFVNKKNKTDLNNAPQILQAAIPALEAVDNWNNDTLFEVLSRLADSLGFKKGAVMWVVRIAVSGAECTPGGATEILEILGRDESIKRLNFALGKI
jgi:glutamyl-tRNA synthetase